MVLADGEMMYKPMAVNEKLKENYGKMFADFERYADNMNGHTVQDFLEGNAVVYFSDTSDYYTVRNALQSSFSMISIDTEHVICEFCDYWSIGACDGNTEIAAKEILAYFFTNNIQDQYYVQTNLPGLPVEKVAVKDFAWVTRSIAGLLEDCSGYTFEKQ